MHGKRDKPLRLWKAPGLGAILNLSGVCDGASSYYPFPCSLGLSGGDATFSCLRAFRLVSAYRLCP